MRDCEKERILYLRNELGWRSDDIAADVKRSACTVERFVTTAIAAGLTARSRVRTDTDWTPERIAELERLWLTGLSGSEIGKRFQVSKNAILGKVRRLGLPGRPSPLRPRKPGTRSKARTPVPARQVPALPVPTAEIVCLPHVSSPPQPQERSFVSRPMREREHRCDSGKRCKWPTGDGPIRFECEGAPVRGRAYCAEHMARAVLIRVPGGKTRPWTPEDERPRRRTEAA